MKSEGYDTRSKTAKDRGKREENQKKRKGRTSSSLWQERTAKGYDESGIRTHALSD
jgi:hypothetical protein